MITVFSTYRTASTYLCNQLQKENTSYKNLGEHFHEKFLSDHKQRLSEIFDTSEIILKIFPHHLNVSKEQLLPSILELSKRNIFLIRPDFDSQVQSYYIAKYLNRTEKKTWHEEWNKPIEIELDKEYYQRCVNFLHKEYYTLSDLYNKVKNKELIFTNQLEQHKYKRPVIWDKKPGYTNIDIEELFV